MKLLPGIFLVFTACGLWAADVELKNGELAWSDRAFKITDLSAEYENLGPVPAQACTGYRIVFPADTKRALIGLCRGAALPGLADAYKLISLNSTFKVGPLVYELFVVENPPAQLDCSKTRAGGVLLALNDKVPAVSAESAPAAVQPAAPVSAPAVAAAAAPSGLGNGSQAWSDRAFKITDLSVEYENLGPVPAQACTGYRIVFPADTKRALIGLCRGAALPGLADAYKLISLNSTFKVGPLVYELFVVENPPAQLDCSKTRAGGVLLALNDNVPAVSAESAAPPAAAVAFNLENIQTFPGQEYSFAPGNREVMMYVKAPSRGIDAHTGFMLLLHNWGGRYTMTVPWCDDLCDRYNVIAISVEYLQSGPKQAGDTAPYDHGLLQAMDCLRAIYHIQRQLDGAKVAYNPRRLYSAGGSGGGNVSQMVNKLAPASFGCIVDICGMPGLTDDIAFGRGKLNAGYSESPDAPTYLSPAMREIRDFGHPGHLAAQKKINSANKVVIVHGLDDKYCSAVDKIAIYRNMAAAGFKPDAYFLTPAHVDGSVITDTGHAVGNRLEVIKRYGDVYLRPDGAFRAQSGPTDFEQKHKVSFPVTGGVYTVDFSAEPTLHFQDGAKK